MATPTENTYVGDGITTLYSFTFPYIEPEDVKVSVNDVNLVRTTEYIFANATTIQLTTAPVSGASIKLYRQTDSSDIKWVFFPGSAIRAQDLNDNFTQNLYVTQEAEFGSNSADAAAKEAAQSAKEAAESAEEAERIADSVQGVADNALSNSQTALSKAIEAEGKAETAATVAVSAKIDAQGATVIAEQALASVLEVVPFEIVANVAAIPTSPSNSDKVQVTDSTGIESFSPLAGLPAGFVGDPGIYVSISYSQPSSTWFYDSYNANNPDDRYSGALDALSKSGGTMTGPIVFVEGQEFPIDGVPDASTTVKGVVQLSNSFDGASVSLAVTEKALSEGLSSVEFDLDLDILPSLPS